MSTYDSGVQELLDGGSDADVTVCTTERECSDGLFCNGAERCVPADPAAAANGCVAGPPPCDPVAELCIEGTVSCRPRSCDVADADGDGYASSACGGADCDDADRNRFPGNDEVCRGDGSDADSHDEDCDDSTVGELDADGDGYVSIRCSNGDNRSADCDDSNASVHPGVSEVCNGWDDDCDGTIDTSLEPLCPGGVCRAGRCDLRTWDHTFGGEGSDFVRGVGMDAAGNVFVGGWVSGTDVDYSDGMVEITESDAFIISFGPDGRLRWRATGLDISGIQYITGLAMAGDIVFATLHIADGSPSVDLGGGIRHAGDTVLYAVNAADGSYAWDISLPSTTLWNPPRLVTIGSDVIVVSSPVPGLSNTPESPTLQRFGADGTMQWTRTYGAADSVASLVSKPALRDDRIIVTGDGAGSPGEGTILELAASDGTVLRTVPIDHIGGYFTQLVTDSVGRVYAAGTYKGSLIINGTTYATSNASSTDGFVVSFDADWVPRWVRTLGGTGNFDSVNGLAVSSDGDIWLAGNFSGTTCFAGSGACRATETTRAGFVARYSSTNVYLWDIAFGMAGPLSAESTCSVLTIGPADSTVAAGFFTGQVDWGTGFRVSRNDYGPDAFVVRLGN